MKSSYIFIVLAIMVFVSCSKDETPTDSSTNSVIMPLKFGNKWISRITAYDSIGSVLSSGYDTIHITSDTIIQGVNWYNGLYANRPDGLWLREGGGIFLFAKYPASINDSYYINFGNDSVKVISTNMSVTVPSGNYSCYQYRITHHGNTEVIFYFAVDKGFIKAEYYTTKNGRTYELIVLELQTLILH